MCLALALLAPLALLAQGQLAVGQCRAFSKCRGLNFCSMSCTIISPSLSVAFMAESAAERQKGKHVTSMISPFLSAVSLCFSPLPLRQCHLQPFIKPILD